MFKDDTDHKVHMGRFLAALTDTGLRKTDPRLLELRNNLMEVHTSLEYPEDSSINSLQLEKGPFKRYWDGERVEEGPFVEYKWSWDGHSPPGSWEDL
ncbi:putative glutaminase 3 [Penaeus indicus]|uniref:putative glutaminase 3 n=1 Tax=Penaeus indicus TaxID=29960 RepID=UPI00300D39ED